MEIKEETSNSAFKVNGHRLRIFNENQDMVNKTMDGMNCGGVGRKKKLFFFSDFVFYLFCFVYFYFYLFLFLFLFYFYFYFFCFL